MKIKKSKARATAPAKKRATKKSQFRSLDEVCKPDMIAYHFWREWHLAKERNDYGFMFEMTREGSALRQALGPEERFPEACRRREAHIPGLQEGELRTISLEGPDVAHMFEVVEPRRQTGKIPVTVRRWFMLRGPSGWRLESVDEQQVAVDEVPDALNKRAFAPVKPPEGFVGYSESTVDEDDADANDARSDDAGGPNVSSEESATDV